MDQRGLSGKWTYRFVDPGTGTDDIYSAEFRSSDSEHSIQMTPFPHVCLLEYSPRGATGRGAVIGDKLLGFRTELEVCKQDVALATEDGACKSEIDAWSRIVVSFWLRGESSMALGAQRSRDVYQSLRR